MAKGNQQGNVQGSWQQNRPSGMLGPNPQTSMQQGQQQQAQGGGYAYPWMQAGKWGDIGGSGLSGLDKFLSQYSQQATGTPSPTGAPSAPSPTTPTAAPNAIATDADPYAANGSQQQMQQQQQAAADNGGYTEPGQRANLPGFTRPVGQGPWTYDGTPFTWDDGISQGVWTVPGTLDANNWPTLPDRSTWPDPPEGFSYGEPTNYPSRRTTTSLLTPAQVEAAMNVPAAWANSSNPKELEAFLNAQYGGAAILRAQNKANNASNPMGATTAQDLAIVLKKGGMLPDNWGL